MKTFQNLFLLFLLCLTSCQAKTEAGKETKHDTKQQNTTWNKENKELFCQLPDSITGIVAWAKYFIGTPYESATLEKGSDSSVLINLGAFDCTTYVENVLAISALNSFTEQDFVKVLEKIRYRNGKPEGYASRLHYFREWILDNEKKGFIKNITKDLGGISVKKRLDFMTKHRKAYPALQDDAVFAQLLQIEQKLSKEEPYLLPLDKVANCENQIQDGDIIAFATNIDGLDFVHVGFAIHKGETKRLHLLHASGKSGEVVISEQPLAEYATGRSSVSGIVVLRVL